MTLHVDMGRLWRGGQGQALLLMQGLQARGYRVELAAPGQSPLAERARRAGLPVGTLGVSSGRLKAALALSRRLRRGGVGVVHCHDAHSLTAAWLAGVHRRCPLVASRRLVHPLSGGWLGPARYRAADRILAVSQSVSRAVVAAGIPPDSIEVVYDGVPVPPPASQAEREQARRLWLGDSAGPLVGCVGYLIQGKGQEALIRAMPLLLKEMPECRLLLAGDGPHRPRLERLAADLGVISNVRFAGHVEDVSAVYRAIDVFLFPSVAEGLGSSLLAAMAHSLPAVGAASGAVAEIIEDGRNGLLVATSEPAGFAAAALRLLRDPGLARALGAAARQTIAGRFSADRMVEETLSVYRRLPGR